MRIRCDEPECFAKTGNELSLSGIAVAQLLKAVIEKGKAFKFKARGWSMSPFIRDGDVLVLSPLLTSTPQTGDVVCVIDPFTEKLIVHRIVHRRNGRYQIKGDSAGKKNARFFDLNHIYACVTQVERNGKPVRFGLGRERRVIAFFSKIPVVLKLFSKTLGLLRRIEKFNE